MHHLVVKSHLFQRLLVIREFHMGFTRTGSGGAYIMHCWHYGSVEGAICLYLFHDPVYSQEEQVLSRSMDSRMYIKERICLDPPFALDVKGGE